MADAIDNIYSACNAKARSATLDYTQLPKEQQTDLARDATRFQLDVIRDRALTEYRDKYRPQAHHYREVMERWIGPTAHDARAEKLYDISDIQTTNENGHTIFLSNFQLENLPEIAADLRSLALQLPDRPE